jgi:hypothetical protein
MVAFPVNFKREEKADREIVILWGICVAMNCVCKNFGSLITVRVLLGCFESAVAPA